MIWLVVALLALLLLLVSRLIEQLELLRNENRQLKETTDRIAELEGAITFLLDREIERAGGRTGQVWRDFVSEWRLDHPNKIR